MKLSIIIPTLNEAVHISKFLNNLKILCDKQLATEYELILVDGGSSDQTLKLAKNCVDKIIHSEKGRAIQQNAGAKHAIGEYLLFLHADSYLSKIFFKEIENLNSSSQLVWGRFDVVLSGAHKGLRVIEFMMNLRSRVTGIATGDQGIFVTREAFEQLGGFADLALMEDIELCARLKKQSPPYNSKLKIITSSRKWEKNGIFKTMRLMWWYRLLFYFGVDSKILEKKYYSS
ncbi:MAG: TIGR04283 family arsenosugar biosynthesis glycosyltransferase [Pseudomonadota bacterium]